MPIDRTLFIVDHVSNVSKMARRQSYKDFIQDKPLKEKYSAMRELH